MNFLDKQTKNLTEVINNKKQQESNEIKETTKKKGYCWSFNKDFEWAKQSICLQSKTNNLCSSGIFLIII